MAVYIFSTNHSMKQALRSRVPDQILSSCNRNREGCDIAQLIHGNPWQLWWIKRSLEVQGFEDQLHACGGLHPTPLTSIFRFLPGILCLVAAAVGSRLLLGSLASNFFLLDEHSLFQSSSVAGCMDSLTTGESGKRSGFDLQCAVDLGKMSQPLTKQ